MFFKIKSGTSPDYMTEQFTLASSVHSYSTRFGENGCFSLPKVKSFGRKYFAYRGCMVWNDLPNNIQQIQALKFLKTQLNLTF